jgi:hypothetical protein
MIIIKIPIEFTIQRLEAVTDIIRLYLMQSGAFVNGKINGSRKSTMKYQVILKLTDKLVRKLTDKKLAPAKSKTFKIRLHYHEAYFLFDVLINSETLNTESAVYIDTIIRQLDQQL